jgi:hypothetical protein
LSLDEAQRIVFPGVPKLHSTLIPFGALHGTITPHVLPSEFPDRGRVVRRIGRGTRAFVAQRSGSVHRALAVSIGAYSRRPFVGAFVLHYRCLRGNGYLCLFSVPTGWKSPGAGHDRSHYSDHVPLHFDTGRVSVCPEKCLGAGRSLLIETPGLKPSLGRICGIMWDNVPGLAVLLVSGWLIPEARKRASSRFPFL